MTKGEIWINELPGRAGHVQRGTRPTLILADVTQSIALMIPFTSQEASKRFPYIISVEPTKQNGLLAPSVLLLYQLGAVDKRFFQHSLGTLETETMQQVNSQLQAMLQL